MWDLPGAEIWPCLLHWLEDSWPLSCGGSPLSFSAETWALQSEKDSHHPVSLCLRLNLSSRCVDSVVPLEDSTPEVGRGKSEWATFLPGGLLLPVPSLLPPCLDFWVRDAWFIFPGLSPSCFSAFLFLLKNNYKGRTIERQKNQPQATLFIDTVHSSGDLRLLTSLFSREGVLLMPWGENSSCLMKRLPVCSWEGRSLSHILTKKSKQNQYSLP